MKLAEALLERKAIKEKIQALRERMLKDARVQEGEKPAEAPAELMAQVAELTVKLERLTVAINRTNVVARLPDGMTLMEAIVRRDMLRLLHEAARQLADAASKGEWRLSRSEIKTVPTVDVADWRRRADDYARQYRELDAALQAANWTVELQEE